MHYMSGWMVRMVLGGLLMLSCSCQLHEMIRRPDGDWKAVLYHAWVKSFFAWSSIALFPPLGTHFVGFHKIGTRSLAGRGW